MIKDFIDFVIANIIGMLIWFFGEPDGFIKVLLSATIIDYISGVCVAYTKHELSSAEGFKGIIRKIVMFLLVGIANMICINLLPPGSESIKNVVCLFYISNEGLSIIENAHALGIPFPKFLKDRLLNMAEGANDGKNKNESTNSKRVA